MHSRQYSAHTRVKLIVHQLRKILPITKKQRSPSWINERIDPLILHLRNAGFLCLCLVTWFCHSWGVVLLGLGEVPTASRKEVSLKALTRCPGWQFRKRAVGIVRKKMLFCSTELGCLWNQCSRSSDPSPPMGYLGVKVLSSWFKNCRDVMRAQLPEPRFRIHSETS